MSRERLEEIEGKHSTITITSKQDGFEYTEVIVEDLVFLIQNGYRQAERVQELETVIEQDKRQSVLEGLYEQNKRYREALFKMDDYDIELGDMREDMQEKLLQIKYIKDKALEE